MKLIENWNKFYNMWSIRILFLITIFPDIYNGIVAMGWLDEAPKPFVWTIRILGTIGIISRLIKQNNVEEKK